MRLRNINRKGQVNTLAPAILALVFAAVVLVFGLVMTQELRDTQAGSITAGATTNESLTISHATSISTEIANSDSCGYQSWNASAVINCTTCPSPTNNTLLEGTDYVINANGSISNRTSLDDGTNVWVTYTHTWGGIVCESANDTIVGLGTFADFWEIIILAIVITVVIGLLLVIFGGATGRRR